MAATGAGDVARSRGDHRAAAAAYEEAIAGFEALGLGRPPQGLLHNLGHVALAGGDPRRAARLFLESADLYRATGGDRRGVAECLIGLAGAAVRSGQHEAAARLFGAAEAALEALGSAFSPANRTDYDRSLGALRTELEGDRLAAAWAAGRALSLDDALTLARALADGAGGARSVEAARRPAAPIGDLTAREREVAGLLARGLTNRQVAEALVITEKTAANHVQRVMDKLDLHSRARIAARADALGLSAGMDRAGRPGDAATAPDAR